MSEPSSRYSLHDFPPLSITLPAAAKRQERAAIQRRQNAIIAVAKEKLGEYDEHAPTIAATSSLSRDELRRKVTNSQACAAASDLLHAIDEVASEILTDQPKVAMVRNANRAFLRGYYFFHNQKSAFPTYSRLTDGIELSALSMLRHFERLCDAIRESDTGKLVGQTDLFVRFKESQTLYYNRLQRWADVDRKRDRALRARMKLASGQIRHAKYTEQENMLYHTLVHPSFNLPTEPNQTLLKIHFDALQVGIRKETPDLREAIPIIQELRASLIYLNRDTPSKIQLIQRTISNKLLEETFTIRGLEQPKEQRLILRFLLNELKRVESEAQREITETWIQEHEEELSSLPIDQLPTVLRQLLSKIQQVTIDRSQAIVDRAKEDNGIDHLDAIPTLRAAFLERINRKEVSTINTEQWFDAVMQSGNSLGLTSKRKRSRNATEHVYTSAFIGIIKRPRSLEPYMLPETLRLGYNDTCLIQNRFQIMVREAVLLEKLPDLLARYRFDLPEKVLRDVRIDLHNRFGTPMEAEAAAKLATDIIEKALFTSDQPIAQEKRERMERDLRSLLYVESRAFKRHSNGLARCWHAILYGNAARLPEKLKIMEERLNFFVKGSRKVMAANLAVHRPFYEQLTNSHTPTHPISLIANALPLDESDLPEYLKEYHEKLLAIQFSLRKAALLAHGVTLIKQALFYREESSTASIAYITTGTPAAAAQMSDEKLLSLLAHFDDETCLILDGAIGRQPSPEEQAILNLAPEEKAALLQEKVSNYRATARYSRERTAKMLADGSLQELVTRPETIVIWPKECPLVTDTKPFEATNASSSDGMYHATIEQLPEESVTKLKDEEYLEQLLNEEGVVLHWRSSKQLSEEQVRSMIQESQLIHLVDNPEKNLHDLHTGIIELARQQGVTDKELNRIREWLDQGSDNTQLRAFHSQLVAMLWRTMTSEGAIADSTHLAILHELRGQVELIGGRIRELVATATRESADKEAVPDIRIGEK